MHSHANKTALNYKKFSCRSVGRAMLRVIEYFAKLLKVIQNDTLA